MSVESNKDICRRFFEEVHVRRNYSAIDELIAREVVSHSPFPGQPPGSEGVKDSMKIFHRAFPDLTVTINHLLAEGDKVMAYVTLSGTHRGELLGQPPTGNRVSFEEAIILRLTGGKIVEHWAVADALTLMKGIGALPDQPALV
jgi:predicted ester cyclase